MRPLGTALLAQQAVPAAAMVTPALDATQVSILPTPAHAQLAWLTALLAQAMIPALPALTT